MKADSASARSTARSDRPTLRKRLPAVAAWCGCAVAVAGLLAFAEPPYDLWPLASVGLVPWLVVVARASHASAALAGSLVVGTAFAWASAPWGPAALQSLGATSVEAVQGFLLGAIWVKGIPFAAVGALVHAARRRRPWVRIVVAGLGFFGVESLHSASSAGVPWALLGHSQAGALGVAQLATLGGVPLLSGFLAGVNQAVALAWESRGARQSLRGLAALVAAWLLMALGGLPLARGLRSSLGGAGSPLRLLLVQPDLPRGERWAENLQASHLAKVSRQTESALGELGPKPDAVLWPENLLTVPLDREPALAASLQATVDRLGVPVILGTVRSASGSEADLYRSSVAWIAPGQGIVAEIDKTRAFPVLEASSSSSAGRLLARVFGAAGDGRKVEEANEAGALRAGFTVTVVLCYEALFPGIAAERRAPASVALVNLADDGWIGGAGATRQLAAFAIFRAIEQRLPLVRVAHGGLSVAVDPFGAPILELPENAWAHGRVEVQAGPPPGLVERAGLAALPLATGAGVWWLLGAWARRGDGEAGLRRPLLDGRDSP